MGTADQIIAIHRKAMENQKKALIEKACEWLESTLKSNLGYYEAADFADAFRKAMEE